jgi:hypothetical protein
MRAQTVDTMQEQRLVLELKRWPILICQFYGKGKVARAQVQHRRDGRGQKNIEGSGVISKKCQHVVAVERRSPPAGTYLDEVEEDA